MPSTAPPASPLRLQFKIHGMDCAEEVAVLKQVVGPVVGGEERLAFDILNAKMIVAVTATGPAAADIVRAVQSTGMRAEPWLDGEAAKAGSTLWERSGRTILTGISGGGLVPGFGLHAAMAGSLTGALGSEGMGFAAEIPLVVRVLYGIAILAGGWFVAPKAWYAIRRFRPDMNLLMTIAVMGAIGIGEWFEGATVAFLFALSLTLGAWSVGWARRAIEALMELAPPVARLLKNGIQTEVAAELVAVGSLLLIRPGEKIPLDGVVVRGISGVNQAPITGESVPVTADVYVPGLVERAFGHRLFASASGRRGARRRSKAKAAAARLNGAKGGRPRKRVPA